MKSRHLQKKILKNVLMDEIDEELEEFEELDIPEWDEQEMEAMTEDPVEVIGRI